MEPNELFRFEEVAFDVGEIIGSTTTEGLKRAKRWVNRAMIDIAGHDRRWSWLRVTDSLSTVADTREYSLNGDVREIEHVWIPGDSRQKLDRIPTRKLVGLVPNADTVTGVPRLYDFEGVDSTGAPIIAFYPVPAGVYTINYRYSKRVAPIREDSTDIRAWWGIPESMLNVLIKRAAALGLDAVDDDRAPIMMKVSDAQILEAYAADQSRPDTIFRARKQFGGERGITEGPRLPPEFGYE